MLAIIVSMLLPGAGHILTGRQLKGSLLTFLYALAVMSVLFRIFVVCPEGAIARDAAFYAAVGASLAIWWWAFLDLFFLLFGFHRTAPRSQIDQHLRQGTVHYLRGNFRRRSESCLLPPNSRQRMWMFGFTSPASMGRWGFARCAAGFCESAERWTRRTSGRRRSRKD